VRWWGTLALAAAVAVAVAAFLLNQGKRSYLTLSNESGRTVSVIISAGEREVASVQLDPQERAIFNAASAAQWLVACEDAVSRRRARFVSQRADTDRSHYFTMALEGCSRLITNTVQ
jgi:hypothetical protein